MIGIRGRILFCDGEKRAWTPSFRMLPGRKLGLFENVGIINNLIQPFEMYREQKSSDRFWLSVVASTALAVGTCAVIGKFAPHILGIPLASQQTHESMPRVLVLDANDAMVRLGEQLPNGMNDTATLRKLVDNAMADLADAGAVIIDKRAVRAMPEGVEIDTQVFVDRIIKTMPLMPETALKPVPVPKLDIKKAGEHQSDRPAIKIDVTPEELADLAKPPQSEEDLQKTLDVLNQFADVLEQMQKAQNAQQKTP